MREHSPPLAALTKIHAVTGDSHKLAIEAVYDQHADFVWATLQRLGVGEGDVADVFQEVFVVVQRRLSTFEQRSATTTWLFGICVRVVASHRRRAYRRRELPVYPLPEAAPDGGDLGPEASAAHAERRDVLRALLAELDPAKRAVFVMYEIEEMPCEEISVLIGVPVGTVHSRLFAARKQLTAAVARYRARGGLPGTGAP